MTTPSVKAAAVALAVGLAAGGCGGPSAPSQAQYPLAAESAHFRYYYATGDQVDSSWEEQYHAWATARLGIGLPQKISYYKYRTRQDMGDRTGNYNTNGFSLPDKFEIHTLWPTDNHEVVHVYTALIGRPDNFFNEGIAVAFQVDPVAGDFVSRFNGEAVHDSCRNYLQAGLLILPLDRVLQNSDWNNLSDTTLAYREAGSFVRFVIDTYGLDKLMQFFHISQQTDAIATLKANFASAIGVSFDDAQQAWLMMLRPSR